MPDCWKLLLEILPLQAHCRHRLRQNTGTPDCLNASVSQVRRRVLSARSPREAIFVFMCFFWNSHTCASQEVMRRWQNPVIPSKTNSRRPAQDPPITPTLCFPPAPVGISSSLRAPEQAWRQGELTFKVMVTLVPSLSTAMCPS